MNRSGRNARAGALVGNKKRRAALENERADHQERTEFIPDHAAYQSSIAERATELGDTTRPTGIRAICSSKEVATSSHSTSQHMHKIYE